MSTLTVYTSGASTIEEQVQASGFNESLAALRAEPGNVVSTGGAHNIRLNSTATTNQYERLLRMIANFDTSALGSTAIISAAVLSLFGRGTASTFASNPDFHIVSASPASTTVGAATDYAQAHFGSTSFASIAFASWPTGSYAAFTLSAAGIATINKIGTSSFGGILSWDLNNSAPWSSAVSAELDYDSAALGTNVTGPKLVITYTLPTPAQQSAGFFGPGAGL